MVRRVAARDEQGAGALRIASAHEHVEINKAAELEVAIDLKSQGRSLVWDGGDPVTFECKSIASCAGLSWRCGR